MKRAAVIAAVTALSATALADVCETTYPARLADAKQAVASHATQLAQYEKVGAAAKLAWFESHCRFLTELERVVRKADDVNAFVCDTAKGRPKGLTPAFVMEYAGPPTFSEMQDRDLRHADYECLDADRAAGRMTLALPEEMTVLEQQELLCYQVESDACVSSMAAIAQLRAKGVR